MGNGALPLACKQRREPTLNDYGTLVEANAGLRVVIGTHSRLVLESGSFTTAYPERWLEKRCLPFQKLIVAP